MLLLAANIINLGADLGAMGEALRLLIGGPPHLYVVAIAIGCALLEIFVRYERYVSILKWTSVSLFAYVATALVVDVPWARVAYNLVVPHPQLGQGLHRRDRCGARHDDHTLLLLLAVLAGGGGRARRSRRARADRGAG